MSSSENKDFIILLLLLLLTYDAGSYIATKQNRWPANYTG